MLFIFLVVRDSFFGGRTNATQLYYDVKEDEKIQYVDFCSLYPSVNMMVCATFFKL